MNRRRIYHLAFIVLIMLVLVSIISAVAASNSVPTSRLTSRTRPITANDLKPAACSALNLTTVIVCAGGNCNGTAANELILGSSGFETINGGGGSDCIVASTSGFSICRRISGQEIFINCSWIF